MPKVNKQLATHQLNPVVCSIRGFIPSPGLLNHLVPPKTSSTVRVDTGVRQGDTVTTYYDPMIAKLVTWAPNRKAALQKLKQSLEEYQVRLEHVMILYQ